MVFYNHIRDRSRTLGINPSANGRNIVGQQLPTLLDATCCFRLHTLLLTSDQA